MSVLPAIGVVVPTLNVGVTLESTIVSLRAQQDCSVEIVVVDSGSTDATLDICRRHGLEPLYAPPGNMYAAINVGMQRLTTPWVTYLNGDDLVHADAYASLLSGRENAELVYGDTDFIDMAGRYLHSQRAAPVVLARRLFGAGIMGFAQPAAIFTRALLERLSGFDTNYRVVADFDFFCRVFASGAIVHKISGPPVSAFRLHANQLTNRAQERASAERAEAVARYGRVSSMVGQMALLRWRSHNTMPYLGRYIRKLSGMVCAPSGRAH